MCVWCFLFFEILLLSWMCFSSSIWLLFFEPTHCQRHLLDVIVNQNVRMITVACYLWWLLLKVVVFFVKTSNRIRSMLTVGNTNCRSDSTEWLTSAISTSFHPHRWDDRHRIDFLLCNITSLPDQTRHLRVYNR